MVAKGVVDLLEVVDVAYQQAERGLVTLPACQLLSQSFIVGETVVQPGQGIGNDSLALCAEPGAQPLDLVLRSAT